MKRGVSAWALKLCSEAKWSAQGGNNDITRIEAVRASILTLIAVSTIARTHVAAPVERRAERKQCH